MQRAARYPFEQLQEPSCFLDSGRRLSLALHLLDEFVGDELQCSLRGEFGLQAPLALFLYRIDIVFQLSLGFVALLARLLQRDVWEAPSESLRSTPNFL